MTSHPGHSKPPLPRRRVAPRIGLIAMAACLLLLPYRQHVALAQTATEKDSSFTNSLGMPFVRIPAGNFLMGSPNSDPEARDFEKPQHPITISKPFYIGRYEVTQAQWEAVMGSSPYALDRSNPFYGLPGMAERITRPNHPATVSWNDAQAFISRLNEREGGNRYRLPSEAEWEYAARAGTTTAYSFGNSKADLGRHAWFGEDFNSGGTHPVGQKVPRHQHWVPIVENGRIGSRQMLRIAATSCLAP